MNMISPLGEQVFQLRRRKRVTQKDLAERVGMAKNTIARLETGLIKDLRGEHLSRLADYFGVSVDYLLGREGRHILERQDK